MNTLNTKLSIIASALLLNSSLAMAVANPTALVEFQAGGTIKASEMNENFQYLKDLATTAAPNNDNTAAIHAIDCSSDADALVSYMTNPGTEQWVTLNLSGTCNASDDGTLYITRDNLSLEGGEIDGQLKMAGKQDIVVKGVTIAGKTGTNQAAFVDAGSSVYFEDVSFPVSSEILSTGTSSIVYNSSVEDLRFVATLSSRLFFFSPSGTAELVLLDTSSSMEYSDLSVTEMKVQNASGFKDLSDDGTLSVQDLYVFTSSGGWAKNLTVTGEMEVFAGGSLAVEKLLNGNDIFVGTNAALVSSNLVSATEVNVETGGTLDFEVMGSAAAPITEVKLRTKASLWSENAYISNLTMTDSAAELENATLSGHIFMIKSSIMSYGSFNANTIDAQGFSYLSIAMPLTDMCNKMNVHGNIEGWSSTDQQGFPHDCP